MKIYYENLIRRLMDSGLSRDQAIVLIVLAMEDLIVFADDNPDGMHKFCTSLRPSPR